MATSADDEDDYEVIYANSPLHWAMINAGLEDAGKEDIHVKDDQRPTASQLQLEPDPNDKKTWNRCTLYFRQVALIFGLLMQNLHLSVGMSMRSEVFKTLADSHLLTEEDKAFLQDLIDDQDLNLKHSPPVTNLRKMALLVTVTACFIVVKVSSHMTGAYWMIVVSNTVLALCLSVLIVQTTMAVQNQRSKRMQISFQSKICRILTAASECMDVAAKCIRFIQESELVARGFTFVSNPSSKQALQDLEMLPRQRRQCPELRMKVFTSSKGVFFTFRRSFCQLVHIYPVPVEVSGVMRHCSEIPLSQYPEMLQSQTADQGLPQHLSDLTDGFSIDILKSMQELNRIHVSEFVRRLAVCFAQDWKGGDVSPLSTLLDGVADALDGYAKDLKCSLKAHRRGPYGLVEHRKSASWQKVAAVSQLRQTYNAVHSLELHLLASLKKIQHMTQTIEEQIEADLNVGSTEKVEEVDSIADDSRAAWGKVLSVVRTEMGACLGCLEEGVNSLNRKKEVSSSGAPVYQPVPTQASDIKVIRVSAQDNPIILDEVFEAYSEPQSHEGRSKASEFSSSEEEAWLKKQKQDLKLCLRELQSIIDIRATEREEREQVAINRMQMASTNSGQSVMTDNTGAGKCESLGNLADGVRKEDPDDGENVADKAGGFSAANDSESDLVTDMERRVEYWKQFDQGEVSDLAMEKMLDCRSSCVERMNLKKTECDPVCRPAEENEESSRESCQPPPVLGSDFSEGIRNKETGMWPSNDGTEDSLQPEALMKNSQDVQARLCSQLRETDGRDFSVSPCYNEAVSQSPIEHSQGDHKLEISWMCNSADQEPLGDRDIQNFIDLSPRELSASKAASTGSDNGPVRRNTKEIVSGDEQSPLPVPVSPFGFSIAAMVASRAKTFAQTEDTFGDSSSDDDSNEHEGLS